MLVGHTLGPFSIEKELGSGAMGTVYLATYTANGQRVAIKIMAPGLVANEAAIARFEREANILKQLRHPNIVRLFGVGKASGGLRYYAMEFVQGESLDRIVQRRGGKLGWEEVIGLGIQLCAALQHAHEKGVVHRDLKPSNLMILTDGTLKLTDFGIAKDLDVTALTGANCTVGTAAYMSPEQCRGDRDLTYKSDLYSLGVVFYELLTGQKPFQADNAMDMFLCHVGAMPERPSRKEMAIPIWLDTLILQLMEKKPEDRPMDANAVADALSRIKEKVEANQSAGEDSLKVRRIDRHSETRKDKLAEEDREAAQALKGKKKKKKKVETPFYRAGWFVGVSAFALLATMAYLVYWLVQPPSAETLYGRAEKLMTSENPDDWQKAIDGPIKDYLASYAARPGKESEQIRAWQRAMDIYTCELLLQNYLSKKKRGQELNAKHDVEKAAFKATDAEQKGNLTEAEKLWTEIKKDFGSGSGFVQWSHVADIRLAQIAEARNLEQYWKRHFDNINVFGREPEGLGTFEEQALLAERLFRMGDSFRARKRFEELQAKLDDEVARKPALRRFQLFAARKMYELRDAQDIDRKKFLDEKLAALQATFDRGPCQSIITLYRDDPDLHLQVEQARALLKAGM